jgi:thiol-disulfide isomerase/thioredoxin
MRYLLFAAVSLFLFSSCLKNDDFILNLKKELKKHNSITYKISEKYWYSDGVDTTYTPYELWIVRDKTDSLKNGFIIADNNYRPYNMIYDNGGFYLAIPPKHTTIFYKNFNEEIVSPIDWVDVFLNPDYFNNLQNNNSAGISGRDTVYNKIICKKIEIKFAKDNKTQKTNTYVFVINALTYTPEWAMLISKSAENTYYQELLFDNVKFDTESIENLKKRQQKIIAENPVERSGDNSETARLEKMLHTGTKAPLFSGKFYSYDKVFNLKDYIGKKVIIVDFWYTHCPPCVKAIPSLSELYKEYKNKDLIVFGLNSVDNQPHSMKNLDRFLKNRDISYDIILTQPDVDMMYKINGYPTMYVIGKDGKIAYVEIGFDKEKFAKLTEVIKQLTDK